MLRGYVITSPEGVGLVVEIVPADERDALFSLEVRFSSQNNQRKITRIGGCFLEVDPESLQKIRKTINVMERNRAQRMHGF